MPYKFLENVAIADVCIEVRAKDLNELFEQAGLASTSVMVELNSLGKKLKKDIVLEAEDVSKLFLAFLEEIVYIKDTDSLLFSKYKVKIKKDKVYKLKARCYGEKINPKKQSLMADLKAVTLHMFEIKKVNGRWFARFVLDI